MSGTSEHEELIFRQRQEKKDLIAITQKMKCSIPKGDKKKKKDVMAEIAVMISDLDLKHEEECQKFEVCTGQVSTTTDSNEMDVEASGVISQEAVCDMEKEVSDIDNDSTNVTQKLSKAQKRRIKKAEKVKSREMAINLQELENMKGARFLEAQAISTKLSQKNLILHEVPSDGNCLFKAIEHQLSINDLTKMSAEELRELTSEHLMSHKEQYQPFLTNPQTDDMFTDDQYMVYCEKVKDPSVWGGHVEVQALANICGKPIEIIQANGPNIISGEEAEGPNLTISYHRFQFGLGAHYNSTEPK